VFQLGFGAVLPRSAAWLIAVPPIPMTKTEAVARISFLTPNIHIDALGKNVSSE
jgi:hypothetical protein